VRLVRTSRLLRRMEDNMGVNYGHITLVKFFVATVLLMHWMACMMTLARTRRPRAAPRRLRARERASSSPFFPRAGAHCERQRLHVGQLLLHHPAAQ